jgi:hypothetical protein
MYTAPAGQQTECDLQSLCQLQSESLAVTAGMAQLFSAGRGASQAGILVLNSKCSKKPVDSKM